MVEEKSDKDPSLIGKIESIVQGDSFSWRDLGYKSPDEALIRYVGFIRTVPEMYLPKELLPPNRKLSQPLPLDLEIKALVLAGLIGDQNALVTSSELITSGYNVWGLNTEELKGLKEEILPSAREWADKQIETDKEKIKENQESKERFLLESWNVDRMDLLADLISSLPSRQVRNIKELVERYKNIQRPIIASLAKELEEIVKIEDSNTRRETVHELANKLIGIVGYLTYLTPNEIREINQFEHSKGFLFLDTFRDIFPLIYNSSTLAKQRDELFETTGRFVSSGKEADLINQREGAIDSLLYGAKDNHSVRSRLDKLRGRRGRRRVSLGIEVPTEEKLD